ncbi:MAG TPA: methylmalonyl-CoA mutase, partial [Phaeodactylibacter sp.]|nr:methylmalonyl-CoA mutase [Phaeodactylibacter sp.]
RNKIQEESMYYESLKLSGKLPIIGVNTFLGKDGSPTILPKEVIRATEEEKERQIQTRLSLQKTQAAKTPEMLSRLQRKAVENKNTFDELMETTKYCTLGQITNALYEVGGQYRRNM